MLGMLFVVPLGLALVGGWAVDRVRRWWLPAAVCGAASLWLPRGAGAAALAGVYALATVALAACAPLRLATQWRRRGVGRDRLPDEAAWIGRTPPVAAAGGLEPTPASASQGPGLVASVSRGSRLAGVS